MTLTPTASYPLLGSLRDDSGGVRRDVAVDNVREVPALFDRRGDLEQRQRKASPRRRRGDSAGLRAVRARGSCVIRARYAQQGEGLIDEVTARMDGKQEVS